MDSFLFFSLSIYISLHLSSSCPFSISHFSITAFSFLSPSLTLPTSHTLPLSLSLSLSLFPSSPQSDTYYSHLQEWKGTIGHASVINFLSWSQISIILWLQSDKLALSVDLKQPVIVSHSSIFLAYTQISTFLQPMALECLYPEWDYIHYGYLAMSSPFLLLAFVLLCRSLIVIVRLISGISPQRMAFWHSYFMYVWHFCSVAVYISVASYCLSTFNCQHFSSIFYLSSAPYVDCNSDRFKTFHSVSIVTTALFVIGYPLLHVVAYFQLRRSRSKLRSLTGQATDRMAMTGFFGGFLTSTQILRNALRSGKEHWIGSSILPRKLLIMAVSMLFPRDSVVIAFFFFLILPFALYLQIAYKPFRTVFDNLLEVALLFANCLSQFARVTTLLRGAEGSETVYRILLKFNYWFGIAVLAVILARFLWFRHPFSPDRGYSREWLQSDSVDEDEDEERERERRGK